MSQLRGGPIPVVKSVVISVQAWWGLPGIDVSGSVGPVDYEALRALLEARYVELRRADPMYGEVFRAAWGQARTELCEAHGWTVAGFYAELDLRRRSPGL